ncbi:MAG TPA: type II toxin-antitoxin system PemK/MazF family toxin [Microbacteriaceae bacterium]|nr:type II toxin-antitoxin system PemK/MazF family toxin [Microbacteriaceae bacterium]
MDDLQGFLATFPMWIQAIFLIVVVTVGVLFGNRRRSKNALSFIRKSSKTYSPGQSGKDATTDLKKQQISHLKISYSPKPDNDPDPGEVVWTWVPFVENDGRGKDRPVLIIARIDSSTVAGCYMSTKLHRGFIEVGPGPWDKQGRNSYLNPARVLRVTHKGMRREGAIMSMTTFKGVVEKLTRVLSIES